MTMAPYGGPFPERLLTMQIMATRNTAASGRHIEAGKAYMVPEEVSEADASTLVRMHKAVWAERQVSKQLEQRPAVIIETRQAPAAKPNGRPRKR